MFLGGPLKGEGGKTVWEVYLLLYLFCCAKCSLGIYMFRLETVEGSVDLFFFFFFFFFAVDV